MDFYLDTDIRSSSYFVVPWNQIDAKRYVIRFQERFKAENYLKGLSFGKYESPISNSKLYTLKETLKLKGKEVQVYELK